MKYQKSVDGQVIADYYTLEGAVEAFTVCMRDDSKVTCSFTKLNDDGGQYDPNAGEQQAAALAAPQEQQVALGEQVAQPQPVDALAAGQVVDANGNVVPQA